MALLCRRFRDTYFFILEVYTGIGIPVRNEGVRIALHERATGVWKVAGELWNSVNDLLVGCQHQSQQNG